MERTDRMEQAPRIDIIIFVSVRHMEKSVKRGTPPLGSDIRILTVITQNVRDRMPLLEKMAAPGEIVCPWTRPLSPSLVTGKPLSIPEQADTREKMISGLCRGFVYDEAVQTRTKCHVSSIFQFLGSICICFLMTSFRRERLGGHDGAAIQVSHRS